MLTQETYSCVYGMGMCVSQRHDIVIVTDWQASTLHVHSLTDGSLLRIMGSAGRDKGQFLIDYGIGGLCTAPDQESLYVAEFGNARVQQVNVVDGTWIRFIGEGVLSFPQYVDCNDSAVVVSEFKYYVYVFAASDGSLLTRVGGKGVMRNPHGVCLLPDYTFAVADHDNERVLVYNTVNDCVRTVLCDEAPLAIAFGCDGHLLVSSGSRQYEVERYTMSWRWVAVPEGWPDLFDTPPYAVAALRTGEVVIRDNEHIHILRKRSV
jgi:hypothetical protein